MRIYNGKKSSLTIPLSGNQRLSIPSHSVSTDFMPNKDFLSLIVTSYDYDEIALIVSGPFEIAMCSQVSGCTGFVTQSLEEAIAKFSPKEDKTTELGPCEKEEKKPLEEEKTENLSYLEVESVDEGVEFPLEENTPEDIPAIQDEEKKPKRRKVIRKKKNEE